MKNIMSRWLAILALSLFLLSGCSNDSSKPADARIKSGKYIGVYGRTHKQPTATNGNN